MKVACLMPTYGRRRELLENSIQLFINQTHRDKTLFILDDLRTLYNTRIQTQDYNINITTLPQRMGSVGAKYNYIMEHLPDMYDAVVVWDDDDIYLPHHLSACVEGLKTHVWCKPSRILSAYHTPIAEENATGRFHGSIAIDREYLSTLYHQYGSYWIDTKRATFDQEMLQRLSAKKPCDITSHAPLSYIYRWQTSKSGHCSGLMNHEDWYDRYKPDNTEPIPFLIPQLDEDTITTLHNLSSTDG